MEGLAHEIPKESEDSTRIWARVRSGGVSAKYLAALCPKNLSGVQASATAVTTPYSFRSTVKGSNRHSERGENTQFGKKKRAYKLQTRQF